MRQSTKSFTAFLSFLLLCSCDAETNGSQSESEDREISQLIERLEDPRAIHDADYIVALDADLESLDATQKQQLMDRIAELYPPAIEFRASAKIPVAWSWAPKGILASETGATTECGGDIDLLLVYEKVKGAYSNPEGLRMLTNSVYVWSIMATQNYEVTAFAISKQNKVETCIDTNGVLIPSLVERLSRGLWLG